MPVEEPVEEPAPERVLEPVAEAATNGTGPEPLTEPSPEMTEMFREQIQNMKESGKSREEAERSLLRFNLGRRFLGLLDEIYADDAVAGAHRSSAGPGKSRMRGFFTR